MVNSYITLPARYLFGRRLRTVLTTLAVVFGVAVVFSVNMLLPSLSGALQASQQGVTGQVDMTITSAAGGTFSSDVLDSITQTGGVAAASPAFQRSVTLPNTAIPPFVVIGLDPTRAETVRFYQISGGRFLNAGDSNAAAFSDHLAQVLGLHVGDTFKLPTPGGLVDLPVVGIFSTQADDQLLVPLQTAQNLFATPGQVTAIDVVISAGADRTAVKEALQTKLGTAYTVGSAAANNPYSQSLQLGLLIFNIFGILTLFMGAFLIFNTFRTVVVERRRDIGMLRAIGATRSTIVRLILIESALQGLIGTAIGVAIGYLLGLMLTGALQGLLDKFMRVRFSAPSLPVDAFILSVVLGIGTTLLAGLLPAISAGRVPVLAALRAEPVEPAKRRANIGAIVGAAMVVLGIASLFTGNSGLAMLGSVLILTGIVMATSVLVNPIASLLDPVIRLIFSSEGGIAGGNLRRNPGRASVTVSALLIALAVILSLISAFSSIENAYITSLNQSTGADILLLPPDLGLWNADVAVGPEFEQKLAQIPGVGNWAGVAYAPAQANGVTVQVLAFDPVAYPKVAGLTFDKGDESAYGQLAAGRSIVINGFMATALKLKVGDDVPLQGPLGVQSYHIVAIGSDYLGKKINSVYMSRQVMASDFNVTSDVMLMANLKQGADAAAVQAGIRQLLAEYPQLTLYWGADWRKTATSLLDQTFLVLYIAIVALLIPSVLGLINTLAINVLERTREIGVLRAVGATRSQVRRMVIAESLLLGIAGTALGLLAGLALGYAFTTFIGSSFYTTVFYFPVAGMIFAAATAMIMALLASVLPARQAAKVKIVQALQYE